MNKIIAILILFMPFKVKGQDSPFQVDTLEGKFVYESKMVQKYLARHDYTFREPAIISINEETQLPDYGKGLYLSLIQAYELFIKDSTYNGMKQLHINIANLKSESDNSYLKIMKLLSGSKSKCGYIQVELKIIVHRYDSCTTFVPDLYNINNMIPIRKVLPIYVILKVLSFRIIAK